MTEEKTTSYEPSEEWLIWMEAFDKDDADGKLRAMNYLLIQLIDCTFDNNARLKKIENIINIQTREMTRERNFVV